MKKNFTCDSDTAGKSGQQLAADNFKLFETWVKDRVEANDWKDYIRRGLLNRSEIAAECGFGVSVLRQNPAVKDCLLSLEARLRTEGVLGVGLIDTESQSGSKTALEVDSDLSVVRRLLQAKANADQRIKTLEEENAALKAEVGNLRHLQRKYQHLEDHLSETGRLLRL